MINPGRSHDLRRPDVQSSPRAARPVLLRKEAGHEKGSAEPNRTKVGKVTRAQVRKIAELKMPDSNANDLEKAMKHDRRTARSMASRGRLITPPARSSQALQHRPHEALSGRRGRGQVKAASSKFDESVDVSINLGVDPKHATSVRGTVVFRRPVGKKVRVLVLAQGDKRGRPKPGRGLRRISTSPRSREGWQSATSSSPTSDPDGQVGPLARAGPKGLMPIPKSARSRRTWPRRERDQGGKIEFRSTRAVSARPSARSVLGRPAG